MNRLVLLAGALALVAAAGPSFSDEVVLNGACTAPEGALVVTPAKGYEGATDTPLGGLLLAAAPTTVGDLYVDLAGLPVDEARQALLTLSWTSESPISDYDLITDGSSDGSTDTPETKVLPVEHCTPVAVEADVFLGLPTDALTFAAEVVPLESETDE